MTSDLAFVDTETTGLYVELGHEPYEISYITDEGEFTWLVEPDLSKADPMALKVGRFYERFGDVGTYRAVTVARSASMMVRTSNGSKPVWVFSESGRSPSIRGSRAD